MKRESDRKCINHARVHASAQSFDHCVARALDPCHRPEGSWALGTRMDDNVTCARMSGGRLLACLVASLVAVALQD